MDEIIDTVRLDVWLWAARWFKTRPLAKQAAELGRVQVNEAAAKPSRAVRVGDRLRIERGEDRYEVEVLGIAERRGPAAEAQRLYHEGEASVAAREAARAQRRLTGGPSPKPPGRPDKRDRRALQRVGRTEAAPALPPWFPDLKH